MNLIPVAHAALDMGAFGKTVDPIISNILNPIIMLMFAVGVLVFSYGVMQLVLHQTDAEAHTRGRWAILGGVVGMFIMLAAWGIIHIVANTVMHL